MRGRNLTMVLYQLLYDPVSLHRDTLTSMADILPSGMLHRSDGHALYIDPLPPPPANMTH